MVRSTDKMAGGRTFGFGVGRAGIEINRVIAFLLHPPSNAVAEIV
jgi:hypothetical protein